MPKDAKVIRMPLLSDTMTEGKIVQWNKKVGDKVKSDDVIAEVETDKATMEVVGYEEGTLLYIGVEAGQAAKVNGIIAIVGKEGTDVSAYIEAEKNKGSDAPGTKQQPEKKEQQEAAADTSEGSVQLQESTGSSSENGRVKASPLAKKLAADKGIDISKVPGSGDGGRIVKKDVDSYKPAEVQPKEESKKPVQAAKPVLPFEQGAKKAMWIFPIHKCVKLLPGDWEKASLPPRIFT